MGKIIKKFICVLFIFVIAVGCVGCNGSKENSTTTNRHFTIPRTKQEEIEFYGTTDQNGKWIPPKGSHKDKHGNIVNKEGVTIGGPEHVVPDPNAVG